MRVIVLFLNSVNETVSIQALQMSDMKRRTIPSNNVPCERVEGDGTENDEQGRLRKVYELVER
jgi:hypothetical protein